MRMMTKHDVFEFYPAALIDQIHKLICEMTNSNLWLFLFTRSEMMFSFSSLDYFYAFVH
jgi:hypothetical protein